MPISLLELFWSFESIQGLEENCVSWQVLPVVIYFLNRELSHMSCILHVPYV